MTYIVFENEGEIDTQLISLMGVNVKESDSAIGFFGTGLKYAVACAMRWKAKLIIQSGLNELTFAVEPTTIRGKEFELIRMFTKFDSLQLGYTTELGKSWEPWMVYRELWCNAHDEPGSAIWQSDRVQSPKAGLTRIWIECEEIEQAHAQRDQFILSEALPMIASTPTVEIYGGEPSTSLFYRGIAVQRPNKPTLYTYNIVSRLYLTEDRTASSWDTSAAITHGLVSLEDEDIIRNTLTASEDFLESGLDYYAVSPKETWNRIAKELKDTELHRSVRTLIADPTEIKCCPTCGRAY